MTGIIILAAGSSSRLGQPKQNVAYRGKTLLQRAIETAASSDAEPVIVVLGANAEEIQPTIKNEQVKIIINPDWAEGMASSIRLGISDLMKNQPGVEAAILMLCDQPHLDTWHLNMLMIAKSATVIAACAYNDTMGPPALFNKIYFEELLALQGHEGAKKLLLKYRDKVTTIPFPQGSIDIDTIEDVERLIAPGGQNS